MVCEEVVPLPKDKMVSGVEMVQPKEEWWADWWDEHMMCIM